EEFNARYSARQKTYRYRIWTADVVSPFAERYVHHFRGELDLSEMRRAASLLIGTHDFTAFTVSSSDAEDHVRTILDLRIDKIEDEIHVFVTADGFLRYMVRTIVGTLIEVGRRRMQGENVASILRSLDRSKAGPSAPASGLTLVRVDY